METKRFKPARFLASEAALQYLESGVEHACYQCNEPIEEGTPFCPRCRAPQIRVLAPETPAPPARSESCPSAGPPYSAPLHPGAIHWGLAFRTAVLGVLLGVVPLTLLRAPGLGMMVAGFLTVLFYQRRSFAFRSTLGAGVRLGAFAGAVGYLGFFFIVFLAASATDSWDKLHQQLIDSVQQVVQANQSPQGPEVIELLKTPGGLALLAFLTLISFLLFSGLGGLLGAALLRKRQKL